MSDFNRRPHFRPATFDDLHHITRLLKEFYLKAGSQFEIPYDHESTMEYVVTCIRGTVCLVGETSCASAYLAPWTRNKSVIVANVNFWYFQKRREIMIFEALTRACLDAGASHIFAASHPPENIAAAFYGHCGMKPVETWHMGLTNKVLQI
jgi:hypothetical protein